MSATSAVPAWRETAPDRPSARPAAAAAPRTRLLARALDLLERWLARPRAIWEIVFLTAVLLAPAVNQGFCTDDFIRNAAEENSPIAFGSAPLDLFAFSSGQAQDHERLRDEGVFPWWSEAGTKVHFFRPLTSLTHALDHALWPDSPRLEHAQSVAWFLALLGAVWLVYERRGGPRWIAAFALLLFAVDETHGGAIGWISSRNGILCPLFGVLALYAHDRWRADGWRAGAVLGPFAFAIGIGCGEAAVGLLGYLVSYAIFLDRGSPRARVLRLAPYGALVLALGAVYAVGHFGAAGASGYIDPVREPGRWALTLVTRLPVYLHALLAGPASDGWNVYAMVHPALQPVMWVLAALTVVLFVWIARPVLARDRDARFWLAGGILAAAPACAGYPQDRLLVFASLGILAALAKVIVAVFREGAELYPAQPKKHWLARGMIGWLFIASVPLSAPSLTFRSISQGGLQKTFERADASLPTEESFADKTLVLVNPPIEPLVFYTQYQRASRGIVRPAATRLLATSGGHALRAERVDDRTLRLAADDGILSRTADMFMRREGHDLAPGSQVALAGMTATIESVTADGRPASVLYRFERGLDDPSLVWRKWDRQTYTPFPLPAVGEVAHLDAQNLVDFFLGK